MPRWAASRGARAAAFLVVLLLLLVYVRVVGLETAGAALGCKSRCVCCWSSCCVVVAACACARCGRGPRDGGRRAGLQVKVRVLLVLCWVVVAACARARCGRGASRRWAPRWTASLGARVAVLPCCVVVAACAYVCCGRGAGEGEGGGGGLLSNRTPLTSLTPIAPLNPLTPLTPLNPLTPLTPLYPLTPLTRERSPASLGIKTHFWGLQPQKCRQGYPVWTAVR